MASSDSITARFENSDRKIYIRNFPIRQDSLNETDLHEISIGNLSSLFQEDIPWQSTYTNNPYIHLNASMVDVIIHERVTNQQLRNSIETYSSSINSYFPKIRLLYLMDRIDDTYVKESQINNSLSTLAQAYTAAAYNQIPLYRITGTMDKDKVRKIIMYLQKYPSLQKTPPPQITTDTDRQFDNIGDAINASRTGEIGKITDDVANILKIKDPRLLAEYPIIFSELGYKYLSNNTDVCRAIISIFGFPKSFVESDEEALFLVSHLYPSPNVNMKLSRYFDLILLHPLIQNLILRLYGKEDKPRIEDTFVGIVNENTPPKRIEDDILKIGISDEELIEKFGLVPPPVMSRQQYLTDSIIDVQMLYNRSYDYVTPNLSDLFAHEIGSREERIRAMSDVELVTLFDGYMIPYSSRTSLIEFVVDILVRFKNRIVFDGNRFIHLTSDTENKSLKEVSFYDLNVIGTVVESWLGDNVSEIPREVYDVIILLSFNPEYDEIRNKILEIKKK